MLSGSFSSGDGNTEGVQALQSTGPQLREHVELTLSLCSARQIESVPWLGLNCWQAGELLPTFQEDMQVHGGPASAT